MHRTTARQRTRCSRGIQSAALICATASAAAVKAATATSVNTAGKKNDDVKGLMADGPASLSETARFKVREDITFPR